MAKAKVRIEKDSLGEVKVPSDRYYGAQTERSLENFLVGVERMPIKLIHSFAYVKKACAIVNNKLGRLSKKKRDLIVKVCDEIIKGKLDDHFPLVVWQTGSGTQSNMNVNEVISNRAIEIAGGKLGSKDPIHPNDDVNMSQSSNDTFPTAMHLCATILIKEKLIPNLQFFHNALQKKSKEFKDIIKVGRTHLMDATPLTLGQEFSGYAAQIKSGIESAEHSLKSLSKIALGGTAVGTGINAPPKFDVMVAKTLSELTGHKFVTAPNKFAELANKDACVLTSGILKRIGVSFMKIANDIRFYASGPRCGIGELIMPANEPGSSIMPGKVNPTQCESMAMVAIQVIGNDTTISFAGAHSQCQLNVYMPLIIHNLVQSIYLLADSAMSFTKKCLIGTKANKKKIKYNLENTLMLATALNREIGYDKAAQIVKKAYMKDISLKQAAKELGLLTEKKFDRIVDPKKMI